MVRMKRRSIIAGLGFLMLMGIAVYFRLWAIHSKISSDDTDLLRRQFDIANREAMDESAEWRLRYDEEAEKAKKCLQELQVFQESSQKVEDASDITHKLAILQKIYAAQNSFQPRKNFDFTIYGIKFHLRDTRHQGNGNT